MREIRFKDIIDSLNDGFDPTIREELFNRLEALDTEDDALKGVKIFISKHGRDYELMRSTFKSFNLLLDSKEKQRKKMNLSWIKYAAVFILVLGATYYFNKTKNPDLTAYEYHHLGLPVLMGSGNVDFNNAMSAYKMQKFEKAYEEFSKCTQTDTVIYFKGECLYQLKQYKEAIIHFKNVHYSSVYNEEAFYLTALAYVYLGEPTKSFGILAGLASSSNKFKTKSNELFELLSKKSLPKQYEQIN